MRQRELNIAKTWDQTNALARKVVLEFARGAVPNPVPSAVGWFDPAEWARVSAKRPRTEGAVKVGLIDGNVYYASDGTSWIPDTRRWTTSTVTIAPPGRSCR